MTDEQEQAVPSNDTPVEAPSDSVAAEAVETASESVDELKGRIADLESRRTKEGRTKKEVETAKASLEATLADREKALEEKEKKLEEWNVWYINKHGTDDQKRALAAKRAQPMETAGKAEAETWKAIAEEENPQVKKVLLRSAKSGDFLTKKQIASLRASFEDEDGDEPPPVKPVRTTGGAEKTLEQKLGEAKKAGNASEVLRISSQIAAKRSTQRS